MAVLVNWLVSALVILSASYLLPGVHVANFVTALAAAVVLGIANAFLKPVLVILTLPINILTLGLFTFVINAVLILLTAKIVNGFRVDGFLWALIFAVLIALIRAVLESLTLP